jgi:hypothetical protein
MAHRTEDYVLELSPHLRARLREFASQLTDDDKAQVSRMLGKGSRELPRDLQARVDTCIRGLLPDELDQVAHLVDLAAEDARSVDDAAVRGYVANLEQPLHVSSDSDADGGWSSDLGVPAGMGVVMASMLVADIAIA